MKTKKEFFEYSNKREKEFDKFYKFRGWEVKRITGIANKNYDCLLGIGGKWYKVEEKSQEREWDCLLVEIIQDTETNDPGWLYYTKADYLFYEVGENIYAIEVEKLRGFVGRHEDKFETKFSKKGWGRTKFILIPWEVILYNKIGKRLK